MSEVQVTHEHVTVTLRPLISTKRNAVRYLAELTLSPNAPLLVSPTGDELAVMLDQSLSKIMSVHVETECSPVNVTDAFIGWHLRFCLREQLTIADKAYILGLLLQHCLKQRSANTQVPASAGTAI